MTKSLGVCVVLVTLSLPTAFSQAPSEDRLSIRKLNTFQIPHAESSIAFTPDLSMVAVSRNDVRIGIYRTANGKQICQFKKLPNGIWPWQSSVHSMFFLKKSNEILILDVEGRFMVCDIKRQIVDRVIRLPWFVLKPAKFFEEFEAEKRTISGDGSLYIYLYGLPVHSARVTPDEKHVLALYDDGTMVLLDIRTGRLHKTVKKGSFKPIIAEVGKRIDSKYVKALPESFGTRIGQKAEWHLPTAIRIGGKYKRANFYFLGWSGDDMIVGGGIGLARMSLDSGKQVWRRDGGSYLRTLTSDGKLIAFSNGDTIHLIRTSDGQLDRRIRVGRIKPEDPIVDIKAAANGSAFLLQSQSGRFFVADHHGSSKEIPRERIQDTFVQMRIASDGRRIFFLQKERHLHRDDKNTAELFKVDGI